MFVCSFLASLLVASHTCSNLLTLSWEVGDFFGSAASSKHHHVSPGLRGGSRVEVSLNLWLLNHPWTQQFCHFQQLLGLIRGTFFTLHIHPALHVSDLDDIF